MQEHDDRDEGLDDAVVDETFDLDEGDETGAGEHQRLDADYLLDKVIPHQGEKQANFDLVIASQPYRARVSAEFKAQKVVAPLVRALGPAYATPQVIDLRVGDLAYRGHIDFVRAALGPSVGASAVSA